MRPDISVVIPTYNRKEYLQRAIASCFDGNEAVDVEVVAVDDGSTDGTRDYLRQLNDERVRAIFQEHGGAPVARNRGLDEAEGRFIKFLDDDDWLAEGALSDERKALERSGAEMSYAAYERVENDGTTIRRIEAPEVEDIVSALLSGTVLTHLHRFTYRDELISDLRWNVDLPCRQDVDFALTVAAEDPSFVRVSRVVSYLNQHEGERISTRADSSKGGKVHAEVLLSKVKKMEKREMLTEKRKRAAAEGLWQWAHLIGGYDMSAFTDVYDKIESLHSGFVPPRSSTLLSALDSLIGVQRSEQILFPIRRAKRALVSRYGNADS